jgi:hypothetical protein
MYNNIGHDINDSMMLFLAILMNKSSHDADGFGTEVGSSFFTCPITQKSLLNCDLVLSTPSDQKRLSDDLVQLSTKLY